MLSIVSNVTMSRLFAE